MTSRLRWVGWLLLLTCLAAAPTRAASGDAFFDPSLGDFAAELQAARQQGKLGVLLVFEAEGCPFCQRMREQVLNQAPAQQYFRHRFSIFSVDIVGSVAITDFTGREMTEKAFARSQRIRGTPTFLFIGVDGKEMTRYTGATRNVAEFMALGRFVAEGHYQKTDFGQFYPDSRPARRIP
jgi:thioredoxin-related protein